MIYQPETLSQNLDQLYPVYLITGEEYWLIKYCKQQIINAAKKKYATRFIFNYELDFCWNEFNNKYNNQDFFSSHKIIELAIGANLKALDKKQLQQLTINPENILIITSNTIIKKKTQENWFKQLQAAGAYIPCEALSSNKQKLWISKIANKFKLKLTPEAITELHNNYEDNMIGIEQVLYQIQLTAATETINQETIAELVTEQSNYKIYELKQAIIEQNPEKIIKIIQINKQENPNFNLILWYLRKTIEEIHILKSNDNQEQQEKLFKKLKIWGKNKNLYRLLVNNVDMTKLNDALIQTKIMHEQYRSGCNKENWTKLLHIHLYLSEANQKQKNIKWIK